MTELPKYLTLVRYENSAQLRTGLVCYLNNNDKDGKMILLFSIRMIQPVIFCCKGNNCIGTIKEKMVGG